MDAPVYIFFDKRAKLLPDAERFAACPLGTCAGAGTAKPSNWKNDETDWFPLLEAVLLLTFKTVAARCVGQFFDLRLTYAIFQNYVTQKWLILDFLLHR
jgi:hypothetical protein